MYETNTQDAIELVKAGGHVGKFFIRNAELERIARHFDSSLFKECVVLRARYLPRRGVVEYVVINQRFRKLEPFEKIPVYQVLNGVLSYVATGI